VVACDPGAAADLKPIVSAEDALVLPLARTEWTLELLTGGYTAAQARCAATRVAGTDFHSRPRHDCRSRQRSPDCARIRRGERADEVPR